MNKVEQMFIKKGIRRGGIILYSKKDALEFIKECSKYEVEVLGIDGFFITNTTTQPCLEDSVDFSTSSFANVYEKAIEFLENRKSDLYFEIVCE